MTAKKPTNEQIAELLEVIANRLDEGEANPFRVRAYHDGAQSVRNAKRSLANLVEKQGSTALQELPDIGEGLAGVISEYVSSGRSNLLDQLESEAAPEQTLAQAPGVGPTLAGRIVQQLGIETLPALEQAAHDGRLASVEGFGPRRVKAVQQGLAGMLSPAARRRQRQATDGAPKEASPSVATLLQVDAEYRRRAAADELQKIAPRRFNPQNEAWLPILHMEQDGWRFTALYSNTARAHELNKTADWVVIYYRPTSAAQDHQAETEEQNTVVTETQGALRNKRVVHGREAACRDYYTSQ